MQNSYKMFYRKSIVFFGKWNICWNNESITIKIHYYSTIMTALSEQNNKLKSIHVLWCKYTVHNTNLQTCSETIAINPGVSGVFVGHPCNACDG